MLGRTFKIMYDSSGLRKYQKGARLDAEKVVVHVHHHSEEQPFPEFQYPMQYLKFRRLEKKCLFLVEWKNAVITKLLISSHFFLKSMNQTNRDQFLLGFHLWYYRVHWQDYDWSSWRNYR